MSALQLYLPHKVKHRRSRDLMDFITHDPALLRVNGMLGVALNCSENLNEKVHHRRLAKIASSSHPNSPVSAGSLLPTSQSIETST